MSRPFIYPHLRPIHCGAGLLCIVLCLSARVLAQSGQLAFEPGVITTVAGTANIPFGYVGDGNVATEAVMDGPTGVAIDASGNLYIADPIANVIRKVTTSTGIISTVAGNGTWGHSGDGGPAVAATLDQPVNIAIDPAGNLYIVDAGYNVIRKVTASTGIISTIAGTGSLGYSGDNGLATVATLNYPQGIATDSYGNLYIADTGNRVIRKLTASTGLISTVVGNGNLGCSGVNGSATNASFSQPFAVAVDTAGNIYVADHYCDVVRMVTVSTGIITTVAGSGISGYTGDGGPATGASMDAPFGIAVDSVGNIYISYYSDNIVREVEASTGIIYTVTGTRGRFGFSGNGGPAIDALAYIIGGVAVDASGDIYFADIGNSMVRRITMSTGAITTVAGGGSNVLNAGYGGAATSAQLSAPSGTASDAANNLYIAEDQISEVAASTGIISSLQLDWQSFRGAEQLAIDAVGDLYVEGGNSYVVEVAASTRAITWPSVNDWIQNPTGVATDGAGNVYVSDNQSNQIYKYVPSSGVTTVVAGTGNADFAGDGGLATNADLANPDAVAVDRVGNIYIADWCAIRVVYSSGAIPNVSNPVAGYIYRVAGQENSCGYSGDGVVATGAQLNNPQGITIDPAGNIYIADSNNNVIRKISATSGVMTTEAGNGIPGYYGDGGSATSAQFALPVSVGFDSEGNLLIADHINGVIRSVNPQGSLVFATQQVGTVSSSQTISVVNRGSATLTFAAPTVAGDFAIASGNTCGSIGNSLPSGGSCILSVVFSPTVWGVRTGSVTLAYNGGAATQVLNLTGTAVIAGSVAYDTGTVTLTVNGPSGSFPVSVNYGQGSTPATIAAGLAGALAGVPNAPVAVGQNYVGNDIVITATQPGTGSDYSYALTTASSDPTDFGAGGSFSTSQSSGTLAGGAAATTSPATVYQFTIPPAGGSSGYAPNGNLLSYTDSVMGSWSFSYDSLNRLIGGSVTPSVNENLYYCWSYDNFGNRTYQSGSNQVFQTPGNPTPPTLPCQPATSATVTINHATYNSNNQITSSNTLGVGVPPTYDPSGSGNIISDGVNQYLYDGEGRICATAYSPYSGGTVMTQYLYDASGNRVAKGTISTWSCDTTANGFTVTNQYILGPNGEQMTELALNSGNALAWKHTNVYAGGSLIATYLNDGSGPHFHVTDWLGTRRAQTNYAGSLEQTCQGLPFGDAGPCVGATEQFFAGKERDSETGNDYFGTRYYASNMGRFISPDPTGLLYANPANPQSLNLYSYAQNNPLINIDPTGTECVWDDGSYDSNDDSSTGDSAVDGSGNHTGCSGQGGTWIDHSYFASNNMADWSSQANSTLADMIVPSTTVYGSQWAAGQEVDDAVNLFYGNGAKPTIIYDNNDPFTVSFKGSMGMQGILAGIAANCSATSGRVPVGTFEAFVNTMIDGPYLKSADGSVVSGYYTPEAQLGAFDSTYSRSGGVVNITVTNPITLNSAALHMTAPLGIPNPTSGHFGTVNQQLNITAPDPCK